MRFLLAMARVAMAKQASPLIELRKSGVTNFRTMAEGANAFPSLQLSTMAHRAVSNAVLAEQPLPLRGS